MDFITEALRQNAHWETGRVELFRVPHRLVERPVFAEVRKAFRRKFVTVLRGLRRVGKSVLARQLMKKISVERGSARSVAWFEFDRAMNASPESLDSLLVFFESRNIKTVILDEIAFVPMWQDVIKRLYDRTETKFVVTGSSALELDKRTSESLAGRFETIHVKPFTLQERLVLKGGPLSKYRGTALEKARFGEALALECSEYLRCGGLPEISAEKNAGERSSYVNESLLNPLFYKDLPGVFPKATPDLLRKTLEILAGTVPSTYQLQSLAQILGCSHPTVGSQVELLERALLVKTVCNHTPSLSKQRRTAKKIVFADNGILSVLRPDAGDGVLAENAVLNALEAKAFWRDAEGHEVDCVLPEKKIAVEVKYQEHVTTQDEKNLRYFLERRKGWRGFMITKNDEEKTDLPRLPLWKLLLHPKALLDA